MLFIYPNGPKPTNEDMLCPLFYMLFISPTDSTKRIQKKKHDKQIQLQFTHSTHIQTDTRTVFFFARSLKRTQNFLGVYTCFCVCVWHAMYCHAMQAGWLAGWLEGRQGICYLFTLFLFVQIYHQTFIVVQVSSRLSSWYVSSTLI